MCVCSLWGWPGGGLKVRSLRGRRRWQLVILPLPVACHMPQRPTKKKKTKMKCYTASLSHGPGGVGGRGSYLQLAGRRRQLRHLGPVAVRHVI